MSLLDKLRRVYSLDTLDTRFVVSSTTPPRQALASRDEGPQTATKDAQPSLWRTTEFYVYYIIFVTVVIQMVKSPMEVSKTTYPTYSKYSHLLSDGWIFGRKADNSDSQYSTFRDNVPYLIILLIAHPLLRRMYDIFWGANNYAQSNKSSKNSKLTQGLSPAAAADARLQQRVSFDVYFAGVFMIALHGFSASKVFGILYINYSLLKGLPREYLPAATWIFNIGILFANELGHGYPFATMASFFGASGTKWGIWMDHHGGLISRWEILFNLTILRLISFNMDYYWSLSSNGTNSSEKKQIDPADLSERDRVSIPAKPEDFTFRNYIGYTLYAPLYLTGPIITFNDFTSQMRYKLASITPDRTARYAVRFLVVFLTMEILIHYIYAVAISKADPDWSSYTPFQLSMLGYFNLHHIWLKLLIPWRFFRLWALTDGIDPPENMTRCMSNNYSILAFWRGWHRSFNRWIVRYMFIPLGGSQQSGLLGNIQKIGNYLLVFMFVAMWHDINLRLLMWGWLITIFVIPEISAKMLFPAKKYKERPTTYRILSGLGAIANILMLMVANLVGYALGVDGLKGLLHGMIGSTAGLALFAAISGCLFVGSQIMFEVREEEKRAGIDMKC
ncbi:glycerol:H+ symporter-like protein [Microthyrium microscopicum]|uniref:Glycerol:H+ symporter-like protein n=1 Tax=Microthyrium microscopicum TaxID=703497 RepID=A0A6A6UIL0_9PEZI|nr:glycerol:H+ symporter-like protein [Microthyrium microscopicum]